MAAEQARSELKSKNISLKDAMDPTKGIPDPATIKPKASRIPGPFEVLGGHHNRAAMREQLYIENLIRRNNQFHHQPFGHAFNAPQHFRRQNHPADGAGGGDDYMADMMARMGHILGMRQEAREQHRLARRAEREALRDLRINQWIPQEAAAAAPQANPPPGVPPPAPPAVHVPQQQNPLPPSLPQWRVRMPQQQPVVNLNLQFNHHQRQRRRQDAAAIQIHHGVPHPPPAAPQPFVRFPHGFPPHPNQHNNPPRFGQQAEGEVQVERVWNPRPPHHANQYQPPPHWFNH